MKLHRVMLHAALLVVALCLAASAQDTGSITGTVKDPSGAAIANADVLVTSPEHGIDRHTTSNSSGDYNESALPGGKYDVIVTAPGFKKYQAKGVKLDVAQKARVDIPLEVGSATTEVLVEVRKSRKLRRSPPSWRYGDGRKSRNSNSTAAIYAVSHADPRSE